MSDEIMEEAVTEAAVETQTQEAKLFTQEELDRIVADRVARTKRQHAKELDGIDLEEARRVIQERQNAEIEKQKEKGEFEQILKTTVDKKDKVIETLNKRLESQLVDGALLTAASRNNAVSAEQVSQLLRPQVRLSEDGTAEVYDRNGAPRYNDQGEALTVDELVNDFLTANPHFVKATGGGIGSQGATGGSTPKQMSAVEMEANWNNGGREAYRQMQLKKNR